jgi:glyoxylase-like metal-dependent hydrolase (beta-lactamase superfamily II)
MKKIVQGIHLIDSYYIEKAVAAIYLIIQNKEVAIIETGTSHSIPVIEQYLSKQELSFNNVKYIIPTHVHLDHAGGAGKLMQLCPNASLIIHPQGAKHMIDPSKLITGTKAVYGEKLFNELYGNIIPICSSRVIEADDNFQINLAGRKLHFIDTKGHANHHFCIWDKTSQSIFTGDTFGVSYREFDIENNIFIFPTTTPVQFNPKAMLKSIDKIMSYNPRFICLTHFGIINPTEKVVNQLKQSIKIMSNIAVENYNKENKEQVISNLIMEYLLQSLTKMGIKNLDLAKKKLTNDVNLNTQGLIFWQQKVNKTSK